MILLYKQNPLEKFFIFTIYQNYTLTLITISFNLSWATGNKKSCAALLGKVPMLLFGNVAKLLLKGNQKPLYQVTLHARMSSI